MDNITKQIEEIEALFAIYGDEWQIEDEENRAYSISIKESNDSVHLYVKLPPNYPSDSPPTYEISAPHLSKSTKMYLGSVLEDVYLSYIGQTVIFQWIERIREELQRLRNEKEDEIEDVLEAETDFCSNSLENLRVDKIKILEEEECPEIIHGEIIIDRKSTFQGHVAEVKTVQEVDLVLRKLRENKKIANATHNIYAYRINRGDTNNFVNDCEDDGETQAGSRLLHFLEIINAKNILVVVSRWYGGIHLGPDRFKHINNAARQVLVAANLMPDNKKENKK